MSNKNICPIFFSFGCFCGKGLAELWKTDNIEIILLEKMFIDQKLDMDTLSDCHAEREIFILILIFAHRFASILLVTIPK